MYLLFFVGVIGLLCLVFISIEYGKSVANYKNELEKLERKNNALDISNMSDDDINKLHDKYE